MTIADSLIVVTGLPRAGTSLVMSMLEAGGVPVLTDHVRPPDEDNPRGYFEYSPVTRLAVESNWIAFSQGHAVKVVIPLVRYLRSKARVRVIWINRVLDEVLASQAAMVARRGFASDCSTALLRSAMQRELEATERWLAAAPSKPLLRLEHRDVISDPKAAAAAVNVFLGSGLDAQAMAACINPALYRQRIDVTRQRGSAVSNRDAPG